MIVLESPSLAGKESTDWWMGQIIWVEGGAREPKVSTLSQVSYFDIGVIYWVNVDCMQQIMLPFHLSVEA